MNDVRIPLRALLLADPTVNGLVGGTRIFPVQAQQGVLEPHIVYFRVSEGEDYHLQGPSGLNQTRFQFDSWAQTPDQADNLSRAAHDVLDNYRGPVGDILQQITVALARENYDSVAKLFRSGRDYQIWFRMF
jgi:hypothetical protein